MSPQYVQRLRKLEAFFRRGGRVEDAAVALSVSSKTVRRMMDCLRDNDAVLVYVDKGVWQLRRSMFREAVEEEVSGEDEEATELEMDAEMEAEAETDTDAEPERESGDGEPE